MGSVGRYDSIDLTKFVLAFMVVLIHINPFSAEVNVVVMPVLRLAVPLFFIISAFFFFTKVNVGKGATESDVVQAVKRAIGFTKRNLTLYFFWLAILIVPVIALRGWFGRGILRGVFVLLQHFFFGSTFIASWYIMALIIAVWAVLILSVKLSSTQVVAITAPFFVVSCLMSNYYYAPLTQAHLDALEFAFWYPYNSFWIGLFWVAVGKWISDRGGVWESVSSRSLLGCTAVGVIVLGFEQWFIVSNHYCFDSSVYFSLPLVVVPLFPLLLRWNISLSCGAFLRAASTVTYCLHATLGSVLAVFLGWWGLPASAVVVLGPVVILCLLVTVLLMKFERYPGLSWLRYAH